MNISQLQYLVKGLRKIQIKTRGSAYDRSRGRREVKMTPNLRSIKVLVTFELLKLVHLKGLDRARIRQYLANAEILMLF